MKFSATKLLMAAATVSAFAAILAGPMAQADSIHGACVTAAQCTGSTNIEVTTAGGDPNFYFYEDGGGSDTGTFWVVALLPTNEDTASLASFGLKVTDGGASNTTNSTVNANLVSTTAWTSGALDAYLGISANPNNPIGSYTGASDEGDTSAAGFYVYVANLGNTDLNGTDPTLQYAGGLPDGSFIVGFLNQGGDSSKWTGTPNSEVLDTDYSGGCTNCINTTSVSPVPEPTSLLLMGTGLLGMAKLFAGKKKAVKD